MRPTLCSNRGAERGRRVRLRSPRPASRRRARSSAEWSRSRRSAVASTCARSRRRTGHVVARARRRVAQPVTDMRLVREAASLAALCEVAEESAGGGDLPRPPRPARRAPRARRAGGNRGGGGCRRRARRARHRQEPRLASGEYLDAIGVAARRLERRARRRGGSPFAAAMQSAVGTVEALDRRDRADVQAAATLSAWKAEASDSLGGDPEEIMRGLREFAEQQAESVQEAQREQFATLTLNTAVELTSAALSADRPAGRRRRAGDRAPRRDARAVPRGGGARQRRAPGVHARAALSPRHRIAAAVSLLDSAIVRLLPAVPKPVVQRFSARYIAGATLAEAVAVVRDLNAGGKMATVDVLGEEITREDETRAIAQAYRDVLAAIDEESLDSNVSIKPTALGLGLSYELCRENLLDVLRRPGTSCASTWRTRRRPTTRCGSTASCVRTATTTSASSSRRGCGGRSTTSRRSPSCGRACGSARASTSSRRRSRSPTPRRSASTSSAVSTRCSTAVRTSGSRRTTSG